MRGGDVRGGGGWWWVVVNGVTRNPLAFDARGWCVCVGGSHSRWARRRVPNRLGWVQ